MTSTYCTCTMGHVPPCFTYSRIQDTKKKKYKRRFLSCKSTVYQYTLSATVWFTSSGMQRWEGAKVLESMPVLHYIPPIARQPAFDLRMGKAKYQRASTCLSQ